MKDSLLFSPTRLGRHTLANRFVLPPLTRLPTDLEAISAR